MLVLGWLTLFLGVALGYRLARRVFAESSQLTALVAAPALCLSLLLLSGTYLRSWFAPETVTPLTFILFAAGYWAVGRQAETPLDLQKVPRGAWLFLGLGLPVVLLYALFEQSTGMVVDGDFFVHVASIGLFEEGHYPPLNYFLGVPTGGHFGRQLLIAQVSRFTGLEFLEADWVFTASLQLLSFALLFCLLWRNTRSLSQAMLGCGFGFFGASAGSRIGLADTVANHNPAAFFMLILITWALLRALEEGRWAVLGAGIVLGADAMVYETHFGLMGLALPVVALASPREARWSKFQRAVIVGLVALGVASTTGGTITDMVSRGKGQQNAQQQQVSVHFPKERLFQVRLDNMRPSRPFEGKMRPWGADFQHSNGYSWSLGPRVRDAFWYPVWLSPLAVAYLFFRRLAVGVWFATIGLLAWLVPSVVDFGFFEGETLRWLFVSAITLSICFGMAWGAFWDRFPRRWFSVLALLVALWFGSAALQISLKDMAWALQHPGEPLRVGRPGIVPSVGLIPRPHALLQHHYALTPDDFRAARWLRSSTRREARVLADDDEKNANYRCAMFGLQGRLPAGYLPQVEDSTEPSSYRRRLQVSRFWASGDSRLLQGVSGDYLLLHSSWHPAEVVQRVRESADLKLEAEFGDVQIYRCAVPQPADKPMPVLAANVELGQTAASGSPWTLKTRLSNPGSQALSWLTFGFRKADGTLVGAACWEPLELAVGQTQDIELSILSPHEEGTYDLVLWGGRGTDSPGHRLGAVTVQAP